MHKKGTKYHMKTATYLTGQFFPKNFVIVFVSLNKFLETSSDETCSFYKKTLKTTKDVHIISASIYISVIIIKLNGNKCRENQPNYEQK